MKSEKFYTSYSKLSEIKLITIGLASTDLIKYWAEKTLPNGKVIGEVINANTLHHKTFKPLKGGLFCERIFGPLKDFECACGKPLKYKKDKNRLPLSSLNGKKLNQIYNKTSSIFGVISSKIRNYCSICDVEYTWSVIRRYQLGYINLISPVTHIWYLKGTPSYLSILLDFKKRDLVAITYCSASLTLENIVKGLIPTNLKAIDIVASWKNLKKQMTKIPDNNFDTKENLKLNILKTKIMKRKNLELKKNNYLNKNTISKDDKYLEIPNNLNNLHFRKIKILSRLASELKKTNLTDLLELSFFPFSLRGLEVFKKSAINTYILLQLNIFSDHKIRLNSLQIVWNYILKKTYKTAIFRISKMAQKFDILQNNFFLNNDSNTYFSAPFALSPSPLGETGDRDVGKRVMGKDPTIRKLLEEKKQSIDFFKNLTNTEKTISTESKSDIKLIKKYFFKLLKNELTDYNFQEGLKMKSTKMSKKSNFNCYNYLELYTLSYFSVSKIHFLIAKILARTIVKKNDLGLNYFNPNLLNTNFMGVLSIFEPELKNFNFQSDCFRTFNSLTKLFIQTLLKDGSFKLTFFERYSKKVNLNVNKSNDFIIKLKKSLSFLYNQKSLNLIFLEKGRRFPHPLVSTISPFGGWDGMGNRGVATTEKKTYRNLKLSKLLFLLSIKQNTMTKTKRESIINWSEKKIPVLNLKKSNKLYNNLYCLSYRELWSNDHEWNLVYDYLSSISMNYHKFIPNYENRNPNISKVPLFSFDGQENYQNSINSKKKDSELSIDKNNFFSGSSMLEKLLSEYTFTEIKQIDKQNRILLYQLNKQIIKIKKKFDKSSKRELKQVYKKRDLLIRRTKVVRKIFRKESSPQSLLLKVLPVLPPDLRPIVKMGNQIAASDLNRLYQRVIYRNDRLKNFLKDSATSNSFEMKYAQRLLQEAVDNLIQNGKSGNGSEKDSRGRLLKSLSDILKGKQGRFRQYLLGKRVDYSGRSVIVVGPKLKLHECGLPKEIALELYLPFLLKHILNQNLARTIVGAKTLMKTNPALIYQLLREIMQTSPILLNRAPTLHRLGIQAFQPKLIEGRAILLHPLVCSAFNADFDGDQMAVHVPITVEARAEAWKLMLSRNNILAPSTGDPLAIPSQDMVLGCYYLTTNLLNSRINYLSKKKGSGLYFTKINHVEKAYELKKVDLHANIWLKWSGLIENGLDQEEPLEIRIDSNGKWKEILNKYQKNYSFNNILQNTYVLTTVGRVLFNIKIQNCLN